MKKTLLLSMIFFTILATPSNTHPKARPICFAASLGATLVAGGATAYFYNKYDEFAKQIKTEEEFAALYEANIDVKKLIANKRFYEAAMWITGLVTAGLTITTCKLGHDIYKKPMIKVIGPAAFNRSTMTRIEKAGNLELFKDKAGSFFFVGTGKDKPILKIPADFFTAAKKLDPNSKIFKTFNLLQTAFARDDDDDKEDDDKDDVGEE